MQNENLAMRKGVRERRDRSENRERIRTESIGNRCLVVTEEVSEMGLFFSFLTKLILSCSQYPNRSPVLQGMDGCSGPGPSGTGVSKPCL